MSNRRPQPVDNAMPEPAIGPQFDSQPRHMVRVDGHGWRCVDCGQRFEDWPPDSEPCPGIGPQFNRPGPPWIEPGQCPGGWVMRVYAVPSGTLVIEQKLGPGDDIEGAAEMAAALDMPGWAACLVAYDGDTGERAGPLEWGTSVG